MDAIGIYSTTYYPKWVDRPTSAVSSKVCEPVKLALIFGRQLEESMAYIAAEARRRSFVEAAVRVLVQQGAACITTRRVAAAAKASPASFHYAFKGKEELLRAVVERYLDLLDEKCAREFKPGRGLRAGVRALLELIMDFCRTEPDFHLAQYELFLWALRTPSAQPLARYSYERWFGRIEERLGGCMGRDRVKSQELARLARSFLVVADGMVLQILALKDAGPERRDLKRLTDAVMTSTNARTRRWSLHSRRP